MLPHPRGGAKKGLDSDRPLTYRWGMRGKPIQLRRIRQKLLLSQEAVARQLGVTVGTVGRWERGESTPRLGHQAKLREFFRKESP